jgi:hypothetical protein
MAEPKIGGLLWATFAVTRSLRLPRPRRLMLAKCAGLADAGIIREYASNDKSCCHRGHQETLNHEGH